MMLTKHVEQGGVTLAYNVYDNPQAPVLVLIHGLTSTKESYNRTIPYLMEKYHILSLDLRGHGQSSHQGPYTFAQLVEDIRAVFDQEGIAKATLVGGSFACAPIQQFAVHHPERVEKLVLLDGGFARNADMPGFDLEGLKTRPPLSFPTKERMLKSVRENYGEHASDFVDEQTLREFVQREDGRYSFATPHEAFVSYASEYAVIPLDELAASLRKPVLVLQASRRPAYYDEALQQYLAKFPTAQAIKIPDSPHPLMVSHPEEVASRIDRFVSGN